MRILRPVRLMFLALLVSLVPASSFAGVFISVGFAPPVLPVYEQPPCPEPGSDVDPRLLGLRRGWLLLGARRLGTRSL